MHFSSVRFSAQADPFSNSDILALNNATIPKLKLIPLVTPDKIKKCKED